MYGIIVSLLIYVAAGYLFVFIYKCPQLDEPWVVISNNAFIQNILLFSLLPLQHSGLAFDPVRAFIKSSTPEGTFDRIYAVLSSLVLITICGCWTPIPVTVWSTENIPALFYTFRVLGLLFGISVALATIMSSHDNQVSMFIQYWVPQLRYCVPRPGTLITSGPYAVCRHPIYTLLSLALLVQPVMIVSHLMLALLMIIYAVLAVVFLEEPRLIREFGTQYKQYMASVPRFVPGVKFL